MRADMAKVITERPRSGGLLKTQRGERKARQGDLESLPLRESTARRRKPNHKELSDLLGPLHRFLLGNVGRPWDKVYSEIRQRIHPRSQLQLHVLDHIRWYVDGPQWGNVRRFGPAPLFVDRRTGLLRGRERRQRAASAPQPEALKLDRDREVRIENGIWYEIARTPIPCQLIDRSGYCHVKDAHTRTGGRLHEFERRHGGRFYARRRQLSRKEIERLRPEALRIGLAGAT